MTFVVPFDDSTLARTAVVRAGEYAEALDESVVAVAAIPSGSTYATRKGWIESRAEFEVGSVAERLSETVQSLVPTASFRFERLSPRPPDGAVASAITNMARAEDASVVFIGSENAGQIVQPVSSIGASVTAEQAYEVHIVRATETPAVNGIDGTAADDGS